MVNSIARAALLLLVLVASPLACADESSAESCDGDGCTGFCSGKGWIGNCRFVLTCSAGRFEAVCSTSDNGIEALLDEKGIVLDGTRCVCIEDESEVAEVPYDDSFCLNNFDDDDPTRFDQAIERVEDICGWGIEP